MGYFDKEELFIYFNKSYQIPKYILNYGRQSDDPSIGEL